MEKMKSHVLALLKILTKIIKLTRSWKPVLSGLLSSHLITTGVSHLMTECRPVVCTTFLPTPLRLLWLLCQCAVFTWTPQQLCSMLCANTTASPACAWVSWCCPQLCSRPWHSIPARLLFASSQFFRLRGLGSTLTSFRVEGLLLWSNSGSCDFENFVWLCYSLWTSATSLS